MLHFNLFFHLAFCDWGGTSSGSPVMPSCLLELSLFCSRLSLGFRGEQISFKAANAPISAITACLLLLLLTAAEMKSSHSLAEILWAVWLLIAEVFPEEDDGYFKTKKNQKTKQTKKKKAVKSQIFGSLQERGSTKSFEECRRYMFPYEGTGSGTELDWFHTSLSSWYLWYLSDLIYWSQYHQVYLRYILIRKHLWFLI